MNNDNIRIFLFLSMEDSDRCSKLFDKNYKILEKYISEHGDYFHIFITFFEETNNYLNLNQYPLVKDVVYNKGPKLKQWKLIKPCALKNFDYIWFCDCDLGFETFDWSLFRYYLINDNDLLYQPYISKQPKLNGKIVSQKTSSYNHLKFVNAKKEKCVSTHFIEVQTPFIHSNLYNIVYERMKLMTNDKSIWGLDYWWSYFCKKVHKDSIKLIKTSVVHYDFNNLQKCGGKRKLMNDLPKKITNEDKYISDLKQKYIK